MKTIEKIKERNILFTIMSSINIALPLLLGYFTNNLMLSAFGAFGSLSFMYYIPQTDFKSSINVIIYSLSIGLAFSIAVILAPYKLILPFYIGALGGACVFFTKRYNIIGPGPFFVLMIVSMGASLNIDTFDYKVNMIIYLYFGLFTSIITALITDYVTDIFHFHKTSALSFNDIRKLYPKIPDGLLLKSIHYGLTICIAFFIAINLKLTNYYWVVVACSAVLQADNFSNAFKRFYQYIIGAIGGITIAYFIMNTTFSDFQIILVAIGLMFLIDLCITHNYILGNFFTTLIAILIIKMIFPDVSNEIIAFRFGNILLGTTLAIISMFLLHCLENRKKDCNYYFILTAFIHCDKINIPNECIGGILWREINIQKIP